MIKGCVFNIQKFCTNDGPGIRTAVFLKGCPLDCMWCHNPESKASMPQLSYNKSKCVSCGACEKVCPCGAHTIKEAKHELDRKRCTVCGKCTDVCIPRALEVIGAEMSVSDVVKDILKDRPFYGSEGGATISGGEPFFQYEFLIELLKALKKEKINTCIETSGLTKEEYILKAAEYTDLFLFDYKLTDDILHRKYTGVSNKTIHRNLHLLDDHGYPVILRCPVIPGINDDISHIMGIAEMAESLKNIRRIEIMAYHSLGESKALNTGAEYALGGTHNMTRDDTDKIINRISSMTGVPVKKG